MSSAIETRDLKKTYRLGETTVRALNGVDLNVEAGEFVSIMGPSGSGKSTLMHLLGLLDAPTSGQVLINGTDTSHFSDTVKDRVRLEKIGFVFQFFSLLSGFTALENTYLPLLLSGTPVNTAKAQGREALERVGLGDRLQHQPDELSGGQRQRVAIARAIVNNPRIVLADEPASQLDTETSEQIMDLFNDLSGQGHTVIVVNHETRLGEMADRIIWLEDGLIQDAP